MADLSPYVNYDPDAFPQLAPLDPLTRSLAIQPGRFFRRRAYPIRWTLHVPNGTGDLSALNEPRLATANAILGESFPIDCTDRNDGTGEFWLRVTAPLFFNPPDLVIDCTWSRGGPDPRRWTWLFTVEDAPYPTFTAGSPTSTEGSVEGAQFGQAILRPVPYFEDLRE